MRVFSIFGEKWVKLNFNEKKKKKTKYFFQWYVKYLTPNFFFSLYRYLFYFLEEIYLYLLLFFIFNIEYILQV